MKKWRQKLREKSGTTLVEMIVSMLLAELVMAMIIGVISPAAKTFVRVQRLQFAQMILDNIAGELKSQVLNTVGSVKIYENDSNLAHTSESGSVLEFINTDGYAVLISTERCEDTVIYRGASKGETIEAVPPGRLLMRYYFPKTEGGRYTYEYKKGTVPVARSVNPVFTDKYYMGNYLKVTFHAPDGVTGGADVTGLTADIALYSDKERTKLIVSEEVALNIRYQTKWMGEPTAMTGPAE